MPNSVKQYTRPMSKRTVLLLALATAGMTAGMTACSTTDYVRIAASGDPGEALSSLVRGRAQSYRYNPVLLVNDVRRARTEFEQLVGFLKGEVGQTWGEGEIVTPSNKRYVKYTQNYQSRAIVEFDRGRIRIETVDRNAPTKSLHSAIVTTLLTPEDPRAVDLYSAQTVRLSGRPYLYGLVEDQLGRPIDGPERAEAYADYLVRNQRRVRASSAGPSEQAVHYVDLSMVSDYENRQAGHYAPLVAKYADHYGVSRSLVFAVIKAESNFNPYAVSTAPAYGLMQLVPATGGRDAYRMVKGRDHTPGRDYLLVPENNIELGTAYLSLLSDRYLAGIHDEIALEYCTIAAYNGGAGNVLNLFSRDRSKSPSVINRLGSAEVYRRLRDEHPREETRRYLLKVLEARKGFVRASL